MTAHISRLRCNNSQKKLLSKTILAMKASSKILTNFGQSIYRLDTLYSYISKTWRGVTLKFKI